MLSVKTIDESTDRLRTVTLRLAGEVMGLEVAELDRVARELLAEERGVRLDLAGVTYVDDEGVALLRGLRAGGAEWENASSFVLCLLEGG
jgi:ABC-type transporter Mla MlaB component